MSRAGVALLGALLLGGCIAGESRDVIVTEEPGGPPVPGARVTVRDDTLFGRGDVGVTDGSGHVDLRLRAGDRVRVEAEGFVEGSFRVPEAGPVRLDVYRDALSVEMTGVLTGADVNRPQPASASWSPQEVPIGRTEAGRAGYAARLRTLDATLAWTNQPGASGDLGLGLSSGVDEVDVWQDSDEAQVLPGPYTESVRLTIGDFDAAGWEGATTLFAGPGAGKAYAGPGGLSWTLVLEATFGPPLASPLPALGAGVLAVLVAARLARRPA